MKRILISVLVCLLTAVPVFAENTSSVKSKTSLGLLATTKQEAKISLQHALYIPVLQGNSMLTTDNNLLLTTVIDLSPVSANASLEARLSPLAFLQLVSGASIGSGWNIPIADGLGKNIRINEHDADLVGDAFDGFVWSAKAGVLVQFDLAALFPGEWTHLVFQSYHAGQYRALSSADSNESWLYEADSGENRNGWNYYGNYFIGYQMPFKLDLVGILFEEEQYLYDTEAGELWGDDVSRWNIGPMFNFTLTERISMALLIQWHTVRNFTEATEDYGFYQDRRIDHDETRRLEFYRAILNATYVLK